MIKSTILAGPCGFTTTIVAESGDMQHVELDITSECPDMQQVIKELHSIDAYSEVFSPIGEGKIYQVARKYIQHASCPVPMAIVKAVEAAAGLALPTEVVLTIQKEEQDI